MPCKEQALSFEALQCKLKERIQIETFNQDTLKILNLYDDINGYNNAAGLLADKNHFSGIDIVKFGENISIIQKRITFENASVLDVYENAVAVFRDYYQYEVIEGANRKRMEKIPEAAFREMIANVFYRLGFVEIFGTGITRIKQIYEEALRKPEFEITMLKPISEIEPYVPFGKSKITQLLKEMGRKGVVQVQGRGRGTKYIIK